MRPGKRLRQKEHVAMLLLNLFDHPLPEGKGFRVRIVDPEDTNSLIDPELKNVLQLIPQRPPIRAFKVQRVNVLIFLWRILRVLYGSIRTLPEPFRMLLHVRVIGSALKRDIESNFEAVLRSLGHKMPKVFYSTQLGMN